MDLVIRKILVSEQVILVDLRQKFETNELQGITIFHLFLYLSQRVVSGHLNKYSKGSHSLNVARAKLSMRL